jgi:hypothetical protein
MSEFIESVEIKSELTAVWEALADIGTIPQHVGGGIEAQALS